MPTTISVLLSLSRTCALNCYVALRELGPLPINPRAVQEAIGFPRPAVKAGLARLQAVGLAICTDAGWLLAPAAKQLALPLDELAQPTVGLLQEGRLLQADDQLQAGTDQSDQTAIGGSDQLASQPNLLQAGTVVDAKPLYIDGTNPTSAPISNLNTPENTSIIISFKDSLNNESFKINNNPAQKSERDSEHDSRAPKEKPTKHVGQVLRALMRKNLPKPTGDDDPFPPELRMCVQRLEAVNCPRKRAELAVSRSPLAVSTILTEIERWKAHKLSKHGKGLTESGFPYLVAARIEAGELCPRYDDAIYAPQPDPARPEPPEANPEPSLEQPPMEDQPDPDNPQADFANATYPMASMPALSAADLALWQPVHAKMAVEFSQNVYDTWLRDLALLSRMGDCLILGTPNAYAKAWVEVRLIEKIRGIVNATAGSALFGKSLEVRLVVYSAKNKTYTTTDIDLAPKRATGA